MKMTRTTRFVGWLAIMILSFVTLSACDQQASVLSEPDPDVLESFSEITAYSSDDPQWGEEDAPLTMVVFSDFQCPFCKEFFSELDTLDSDWIESGKLKVQYRDFPLAKHINSLSAHAAAHAAHRQGAFLRMHQILFDEQDNWAESTRPEEVFATFAEELGLNMDAFQKDYNALSTLQEIRTDRDEGRFLGVTGVPSVFINGQPFQGSLTKERMNTLLLELESNL